MMEKVGAYSKLFVYVIVIPKRMCDSVSFYLIESRTQYT